MKTVFIDTSAFYALFNSDDPHHSAAVSFYQEEPFLLITTNYVFAELLSLLTKRQGKPTAVACGTQIRASQNLRIIHLNEGVVNRAWGIFTRYKDKKYDLIDCLSFVCMDEFNLSHAFAFDRHFAQHGYHLVPS